MTKKIILLLVEGPTDEDALALVFSKLIKEYDIEFDVIHGDITADESMTAKYIVEAIEERLEEYLTKNPFVQKGDILKVVQVIDTDGAFIPSTQIEQSKAGKTVYYETHIEAKDRNRLIRRNISKRNIIYHLMQTEQLPNGIPYEIYYFSRNMEHVLHNIDGNLTEDEKEDLAFKIADFYSERPEEFLNFLYDESFCVEGNYGETWKFIMENGNSLKRYCNITVFFERLGIVM